MKVGDLAIFNEDAMRIRGDHPNETMLVIEITAPRVLVINSSTGLIRRNYISHLEVINESR
jgi:hypothetical protein